MNHKTDLTRSLITLSAIWAILSTGLTAGAQDLVPVSDITGGSSVFVFRGSARPSPKRFISKNRVAPNRSQRLETVRKVSKQYVALAKTAPRRVRTAAVDPENLPAAVKTMPKDEAAKLFAGVGEYYMDKSDFDHAIDFFRESVTLNSQNANSSSGLSEALAFKGNDLLVKENPAAARKFFEEALRYNNKNSPAYFGLAEVLSDLDKSAEAVTNYEKALQMNADLTEIYVPLGILYFRQGEIAKAENLLNKAVAVNANDAQTQYYMGMVRYSQNRNEEALAALRKAESLDPTYPEAFYQAGETLVRLGRDADAVTEYTKATALRDNYFDAWFALGVAYAEQERFADAIPAYKKASRLDNTSIDTYINLGDAYRQTGNYNDAEANYNLAITFIKRVPGYSKDEQADTYSKIGFSIAKQCEINTRRAVPCRWDAAVKALESAAGLSQNNVDYANLGWAYYNSAKTDINFKHPELARPKLEKAKENLQKAAFSSPKYIEGPLLNLGMTLTDLGDYAGAVDALNRVVAKQPKWLFALNELGIAYRKQNNYKAAIQQFRKAIDKDDKYAVAHYNLAEAEFQNGNIGEAKKEYEKLKKLGQPRLAQELVLVTNGAVAK
ncbi:MAG TPA: tetratricopeptide repeat protein [Pyrinomonadaceae bacterium]|nr:tetratricopeptide repeat protein [Pyrinomonadaceae bacterium]